MPLFSRSLLSPSLFSHSQPHWRLVTLFCCALVLSSCSLFPGKPEQPLGDWAFRGKMAVRSGDEATSFNVDWLQQGHFFQIELSGPFGQGAVTIKGNPERVTLLQDDNIVEAPSLAGLLAQQTDMDLPLDHLQFWVRALPDPAQTFQITANADGQTQYIAQAGWNVTILEYFADNNALPRKLSFAKTGDSGKLVIREWTQAPAL